MRKTKIICTIGPASNNVSTLVKMIEEGMDVCRLNFSHGEHDEQLSKIKNIKEAEKITGKEVAIMLDSKGPEYRIGRFKNYEINLENGQTFTFTTDDVLGDENIVSVSYKNLHKDLDVGDTILVNNGLLIFKVIEIKNTNIITKVINGGYCCDRKSMAFPKKVLKQNYLSEKDKQDFLFGIKHDVDFIACSFVSTKQDLLDVKNFLHENGRDDISLIAKIENQPGVDNIEEICKECEGIMIGRGDMGVEMPFEELPVVQKELISKCRMLGKRVITATEMLESMINNPRPTRAEISDVANAVFDGTSAVMLSGETAAGKYPVETLQTMAKIVCKTEENINYFKRFRLGHFEIKNEMDAISHSAVDLSMDLNAKAIVVCSLSGMTTRMVSRFRPIIDIVGICVDLKTKRKLKLSWGVLPILTTKKDNIDDLFNDAKEKASKELNLKPGDKIIVLAGNTTGLSGFTNTIRVETI